MQSFIIKFHQDRVLKITQPSKSPSNHRMQQKSKSANMETRNHAEGHGTLYQELCNCNDTTLPNNWAGVTTQYNSINWLTQKTLKKQLQLIFKIHYCSYCSINAHANISALLLLCCLAMWWGAGSVRIYTASDWDARTTARYWHPSHSTLKSINSVR